MIKSLKFLADRLSDDKIKILNQEIEWSKIPRKTRDDLAEDKDIQNHYKDLIRKNENPNNFLIQLPRELQMFLVKDKDVQNYYKDSILKNENLNNFLNQLPEPIEKFLVEDKGVLDFFKNLILKNKRTYHFLNRLPSITRQALLEDKELLNFFKDLMLKNEDPNNLFDQLPLVIQQALLEYKDFIDFFKDLVLKNENPNNSFDQLPSEIQEALAENKEFLDFFKDLVLKNEDPNNLFNRLPFKIQQVLVKDKKFLGFFIDLVLKNENPNKFFRQLPSELQRALAEDKYFINFFKDLVLKSEDPNNLFNLLPFKIQQALAEDKYFIDFFKDLVLKNENPNKFFRQLPSELQMFLVKDKDVQNYYKDSILNNEDPNKFLRQLSYEIQRVLVNDKEVQNYYKDLVLKNENPNKFFRQLLFELQRVLVKDKEFLDFFKDLVLKNEDPNNLFNQLPSEIQRVLVNDNDVLNYYKDSILEDKLNFKHLPDYLKTILERSSEIQKKINNPKKLKTTNDPYNTDINPVIYSLIRYLRKNGLKEIGMELLIKEGFTKERAILDLIKGYKKDIKIDKLFSEKIQLIQGLNLDKKEKNDKINNLRKELNSKIKIPLQYLIDQKSIQEPIQIKFEKPRSLESVTIDYKNPIIQKEIKRFQDQILKQNKIKFQRWEGMQRIFKGATNYVFVLTIDEKKIPKSIRAITIKDAQTRQELLQFESENGTIPEELLKESSLDLYIKESGHPKVAGSLTLGWIRYTLGKEITSNDEDERVWIDEIQTDLSKIFGRENLGFIFPMNALLKLMLKKFIKFIRAKGYEEILIPNELMANQLYHRKPPKSIYMDLPQSLRFKKEIIKDLDSRIDNKPVWILSNKRIKLPNLELNLNKNNHKTF